MSSQRIPNRKKPAGRLIPANQGRIRLVLALSMTVAMIVVVALGASARNALLQESAVKAASDRFERQMHGNSTPATSPAAIPQSRSDAGHSGKQSKVPTVAAPRGIDEGNA